MDSNTRFVQKYDILKLVMEIRNHPCVYDFTSPDHQDRIKSATAWVDIANELDCSVRECKEKWRRIRIAFARSVKLSRSSNPPTRPYHLSDQLQFLVPFLKFDGSNSYEDQHNNTEDNNDVNGDKIKVEYLYDDETSEISDSNPLEEQESITNETYEASIDVPIQRPRKRAHLGDEYKESISPRKMFLLSLVPDVESFSEQEMRVFRRLTISAIDDIIRARARP